MIKTIKAKKWWLLGGILTCLLAGFFYWQQTKPIILRLAFYTGSSWDVPVRSKDRVVDQVIKDFERSHPNVKVEYESGILKEDYSKWLSDQLISGQQPDVFLLPEDDFNLLASNGTLANLDAHVGKDFDPSKFFPSAYQAGQYNGVQYAMPYESNPMMMCVNKDLLEKEGIDLPKTNWSLEQFYEICKQVTKDTDGDGNLDQFGCTGYQWQHAMAGYGVNVFDRLGTKVNVDTPATKKALTLISKLQGLTGNYQVSVQDFDEGKVAFLPMTLAQYRTYQPYPYHVTKYSAFSWECVKMPSDNVNVNATQLTTSLYAISSRSKHHQLAWEFLKQLSVEEKTQQKVFESSQGISVLKEVMNSPKTKKILENDGFGSTSLTVSTIQNMMTDAVVEPKFKLYHTLLERVDYLFQKSLQRKSIDEDLSTIQKTLEDELK